MIGKKAPIRDSTSTFLMNSSYREKIDTENREDESEHRDEEILPLPSYLDDVIDEDARAVRSLFICDINNFIEVP